MQKIKPNKVYIVKGVRLCHDVESSASWEETHVLYYILYRVMFVNSARITKEKQMLNFLTV